MHPEQELIEFPPSKACAIKWLRGQQKYGTFFNGDPIAHLYSELIDAINYTYAADALLHTHLFWMRTMLKFFAHFLWRVLRSTVKDQK